MGTRSWHGNRVFGEYANKTRIKQKHFGAVHLCQEFYAQKIPPNYHSYIEIIQFIKQPGIFCFIKKGSLFHSYKMTAGIKEKKTFHGTLSKFIGILLPLFARVIN